MTDLHEPTIRYLIQELYLSAYYSNEDDAEYVVQQMLCGIRERRLAFPKDLETEAMQQARESYTGVVSE